MTYKTILFTTFSLMVVFIVVVISILIHQYILNQQQKRVKSMMIAPSSLNFNNDIEFLNYIINMKIEMKLKYVIVPNSIIDTNIAKEEDLERYKLELSLEIKKALSKSYKQTLSKYFSEESLDEYIIEIVFDKLTESLVKLSKM